MNKPVGYMNGVTAEMMEDSLKPRAKYGGKPMPGKYTILLNLERSSKGGLVIIGRHSELAQKCLRDGYFELTDQELTSDYFGVAKPSVENPQSPVDCFTDLTNFIRSALDSHHLRSKPSKQSYGLTVEDVPNGRILRGMLRHTEYFDRRTHRNSSPDRGYENRRRPIWVKDKPKERDRQTNAFWLAIYHNLVEQKKTNA